MSQPLIDAIIENNLSLVKSRYFSNITDEIFTIACNAGSFDVALFLFEKNSKLKITFIDVKLQSFIWVTKLPLQNNERVFEYDKIFQTAKWVQKIFPNLKIDLSSEQAYLYLLENNVDVAIWISINKLEPSISHDSFVKYAKENKCEIIKIILELQPNIMNKIYITDFFIDLCASGASDVAKLIYQKNKNINGSAKNNYALYVASKNNHNELVKWLKSILDKF